MNNNKPVVILDVVSVVDGGCTNMDGLKLLFAMEAIFNNGKRVQLSLKECPALTSSFLNSSIGEVFEKYGIDFIKQNISLINFKPSQAKYIKDYIDNLYCFA